MQELELVAPLRRALVATGGGRLLHLRAQALGELGVPPAQEEQQSLDAPAVVLRIHARPPRARTQAAPDVVVETGPVGAAVVLEVAARAQRKDGTDLAQCALQELHVGVRPQVARAVVADVAGHRHPREFLLHADTDVGKALVVLEQDVVRRPVLADQGGLEQQRLDLGVREDGIQVGGPGHQLAQARLVELPPQVVAHPLGQALRLPDVEHPARCVLEQVNARRRGQIVGFFGDSAHGRPQASRVDCWKQSGYTRNRPPANS